ncbi:RNA-directed DNA polymerase, eukaryota [Tanacetum coccineum]
MEPKKRTTRASSATTTTTTSVTNAQLKALIEKGIADALAACDANRSMNGNDSHNSGTSVRRNETVSHNVAYAMTCANLKKKMTDKYCPKGEIKKLEVELWKLKVKDKIERYVDGLPDMIYGSVVASKPKTMQEAIEMETELMDKKICTSAERHTEKKRKQDDNNNEAQQQPPKKQGVAIAYTAGSGERKKSPTATNNQRNLTCYECGNQGHYRSNCPELKNQNHGSQAKGTRVRGMVHALGGGETNQDLNNMEDDINA